MDGLGNVEHDEVNVAAIVQLGKALSLAGPAEGVETPTQLARVKDLGCDLYQGYLLSRPTDAERVDFRSMSPGGARRTYRAQPHPSRQLSLYWHMAGRQG